MKNSNDQDKSKQTPEKQTPEKESTEKQGLTRREMLKLSAVAGTGIAIGASGVGTFLSMADQTYKTVNKNKKKIDSVDFYGTHQAGILTAQQTYGYLASFDIEVSSRKKVIDLFKQWTKFADLTSQGGHLQSEDNDMLPPADTGEALGLGAAKLTFTIGYGPTFFEKNGKDRFGIKHQQPNFLQKVPHMAHDSLKEEYCDGDVCVQVCAEDQQVAFHGIRNFIRLASGVATLRWLEEGFLRGAKKETPRNLFGFKDGTANQDHATKSGFQKVVWADKSEPTWMQNGSYLGYRKIQMLLEIWDRSSLMDQEDTFGRRKKSGAPYGKKGEFDKVDPKKMPIDSHVRLAKGTDQQMQRRAYSYTSGVNTKTGNLEAGLLFICFTQNPIKQFFPMLKIMGKMDKLNEYTIPIGTAVFACQGGLKPGEYFGEKIFS